MASGKRPTQHEESMDRLQRWTVIVLLGLLVFVTFANFIDDVALGNKFVVDNAFYILVGGMISGLFAGRVLSARNTQSNDREEREQEKRSE